MAFLRVGMLLLVASYAVTYAAFDYAEDIYFDYDRFEADNLNMDAGPSNVERAVSNNQGGNEPDHDGAGDNGIWVLDAARHPLGSAANVLHIAGNNMNGIESEADLGSEPLNMVQLGRVNPHWQRTSRADPASSSQPVQLDERRQPTAVPSQAMTSSLHRSGRATRRSHFQMLTSALSAHRIETRQLLSASNRDQTLAYWKCSRCPAVFSSYQRLSLHLTKHNIIRLRRN
ncbi:hypothetical protein PBRA_008279 [Plasmodiophora brassicae]|uniref:C2H2-type domain-containing protein n=1 Tax=Plasmodiophora brassicae TaxID=37360 RepID=A0A0G4J0C7_PLABS|nr:hypothetical protein PBRA_008279 [Plasmodiophora brassicae]